MSDWLDCFAQAIEFYAQCRTRTIEDHHGQCNHADCPDSECTRPRTAHEYFTERRGWDSTTVEEAKLGYAPPGDEVLDVLLQEFNEETVRATGLVTEDLRLLWRGRYVLPVLDKTGVPISASSRATGNPESGSNHPEDFIDGKYGFVAHAKDYTEVRAPIYGLHSLEPESPVILTEGFPDAISAHDAGYSSIAQGGTSMSPELQNQLATQLHQSGVSQVYAVPDADPPDRAGEDQEVCSSDGAPLTNAVTGVLDTAETLSEAGIDVEFVTLPREGSEKLDLDGYLQNRNDGLETLLGQAVNLQDHPAFIQWNQKREPTQSSTSAGSPQGGSSQGSQIFDLDFVEVAGVDEEYRGVNPLDHSGRSENYFVVYDRDRARDHKRGVTYNARSYLLCEAGVRMVDRPEGKLSNHEVLQVWKYAKEHEYVHEDDPIPSRALTFVATDNDLCSKDELADGWKLPSSLYQEALSIVHDRYEIDPGRSIVQEPGERVLDLADPSPSSEPFGDPDDGDVLETARAACEQALVEAIGEGKTTLIDALPAMGKSSGVARAVDQTGTPVTVLTARHELYEQHATWCEDLDLTHYELPAFHRTCPTAAGEHGEDWANRVTGLYEQGVQPMLMHHHASEHLDRALPCTEDGPCPYERDWDFDPEGYDALIGHYSHAYKEEIVSDRVVVFDESPIDDMLHVLSGGRVSTAVSNYLEQCSGAPFDDVTEVIEMRAHKATRTSALSWCRKKGVKQDAQAVLQSDSDGSHALAPLLLYGVLEATKLGNGWERAVVDRGTGGSATVTVARDRGSGDCTLLTPPNLGSASGIIGLEGMATPELWRLALNQPLDHKQVLDDTQRKQYLREGLGLELIQTETEAVKPYSGGTVNAEKDGVLIQDVIAREDEIPALISTKHALTEYDRAEVLGDIGETEHYGNLTGSNQFEGHPTGIVAGSRHYGDEHLEKWGALKGISVGRQEEGRGLDLSYGVFGDKVLRHMREHQVMQAVLRFARGATDTTVYVHTAALPSWAPIEATGRIEMWSQGATDALSTLRSNDGGLRTSDVTDQVKQGERSVRKNLNRLNEVGLVDQEQQGKGYEWDLAEGFDEAGAPQTGVLRFNQ